MSLTSCSCFLTFLVLFSSVANTTSTVANTTTTVANTSHRRILHQPLFPATQTPPPSPPSPPPSPPSNSDNPFFHENPNGNTNTNTNTNTPAAPAAGVAANTTATHPIAPQPANKPAKKIAVVISVGIVTLGMLSALAFFIYKHKKSKQQTESTKVNTMAEYICNNNNNNNNGGSPTPSTFLYIGTVEPSRALTDSTNGVNGSPYNKLNPIKRSDRYRPSPELQPLPPLTKPRPPPTPPPDTTSSDEEDEIQDFYTPNGSIASTDDGYSGRSLNYKRVNPHSKRTSPRSRLSVSSSPENFLPANSPARKKFAGPPPGPDLTRLNSGQRKPNIPTPPQPPQPEKPGSSKQSPGAKVIPKIVKTMSFNDDDANGLKPRLKPLHWDKVRATSDRATVWDQLKSSSFQLNEDIMESLFGCNSGSSGKKDDNRKPTGPAMPEYRVLDPKKSQNIAILLRALNVTHEEVSEALLEGNSDSLGAELLETLVKMAPTKEEEIKLKDYKGDVSNLGSAERFLKAVVDLDSKPSRSAQKHFFPIFNTMLTKQI